MVGRLSSTADLRFDVTSELRLPSVAICQQLLFIVEEFLVVLDWKFIVGSFHYRVYRTSLLTESAVDALSHVYVVSCGSSASVRSWLALDGNAVGRTGSST